MMERIQKSRKLHQWARRMLLTVLRREMRISTHKRRTKNPKKKSGSKISMETSKKPSSHLMPKLWVTRKGRRR